MDFPDEGNWIHRPRGDAIVGISVRGDFRERKTKNQKTDPEVMDGTEAKKADGAKLCDRDVVVKHNGFQIA